MSLIIQDKYVIHHIPKCGGMSVRALVRELEGSERYEI